MMNKDTHMATASKQFGQASEEVDKEICELESDIGKMENAFKEVSLMIFKEKLQKTVVDSLNEVVAVGSNNLLEFLMNKFELHENFTLHKLHLLLEDEIKN
ncbi:hypothetical protein BDAP_001701 [Binucleata daphniae]